jgi:hypothetical protein
MNDNTKKISDGLSGGGDGGDRLIKGSKLKFTNEGTWTIDDEPVDKDRKFLVVGVCKAYQKWIDGLPVEKHVIEAHEQVPDLDALNKAAPPEQWVEKFGKKVGPWDWCYAVYLIDPTTMQVCTFSTNTVGGGQCVRELRESTGMARRMHGDSVYPKVKLTDKFMKTQYGGRQRPAFDILDYEELGPTPAALPADAPKQIEAQPAEPAEPKPEAPNGQKAKAAVAPKPKKPTSRF